MKLGKNYLTGKITVHFGSSYVLLAHKVQERISFMNLSEADLIEVQEGDVFKSITLKEIFSIISPSGHSIYEGSKVRVKLSLVTSRQIESDHNNFWMWAIENNRK